MTIEEFEKEFMEKYRPLFADCQRLNMLRLIKDGTRWTLEYREAQNYAPRGDDGYKWKVVCSQGILKVYNADMVCYTPLELAQRFILMITNGLQQKAQDVNGIQDEYILTRKPMK